MVDLGRKQLRDADLKSLAIWFSCSGFLPTPSLCICVVLSCEVDSVMLWTFPSADATVLGTTGDLPAVYNA